MTDIMSATPLGPGWCAVHSTPSRLLSARLVPSGQAYSRPVGIDCKGTMPYCLSATPASQHLWLSLAKVSIGNYKPEAVGVSGWQDRPRS